MEAIKVPSTPHMKHIDTMQEEEFIPDKPEPKSDLVEKIRIYSKDIGRFDSSIKEMIDSANDMIENMPEATKVMELEEQLKTAKDDLRRRLMSNAEYNNLLETIADEKESKKAAQQILSDLLLAYFKETGERQIELDPRETREVKLKASLGKEQLYQSSLFGSNDE